MSSQTRTEPLLPHECHSWGHSKILDDAPVIRGFRPPFRSAESVRYTEGMAQVDIHPIVRGAIVANAGDPSFTNPDVR
jgi:hypothetical protein